MASVVGHVLELILARAPEGETQDVSFWKVVGAVALVVGFMAAVQQLLSAYRRRRFAKAEERVLAVAAKELDAEAAHRDYDRYEALRLSLRRQVEQEVPQEARRVYLRSRVESLRSQLAADLEEYERVSAELREVSSESVAGLDDRLRDVIEHSIRPVYVRRRRNERLVVALLVALLALALTPLTSLPREVFSYYLETVGDPADHSTADVVFASALGVLSIAAVVLVAVRWMSGRGVRWVVVNARSISLAVAILTAGSAMLVGSKLADDQRIDAAMRLEQLEASYHEATEAVGEAAEAPAVRKTIREFDAESEELVAEQDRHRAREGNLLEVGAPVAGAGLGLLLGLGSVHWRAPRRR